MLHAGEAGEGNPQQDCKRGGLGCGRHQSNYRRWRALVDVGSPDMEGGCRHLEAEADDDHAQREKGKMRRGAGAKCVGDRVGIEVVQPVAPNAIAIP